MSTQQKLPDYLASTIHHIELNQKGWWEKTIQRFILIVLYFKGHPIEKNQIPLLLNTDFKLSIENTIIDKQIEKLMQASCIILMPEGTLKLSEIEHKKLIDEFNHFDSIEQQVKKYLKDILDKKYNKNCNINEEWDKFDSKVLIPLIRNLGAKTYEMISGSSSILHQGIKFLDNIDFDKEIILDFLNPNNIAVRDYILRKLNAHFCYESSNLSKTAVEKLADISQQNIVFTIFVDTNFLFSILELHDNPANEAAQSLIALTDKISNKIKVKYYITDMTIKEAKGVLLAQKSVSGEARYFPNVAKALQHMNISGIIKKYYSTERKTIPLKDYFNQYINNFTIYAKTKQVYLYNDKAVEEYSTKQEVVDDILEAIERQEQKKKTINEILESPEQQDLRKKLSAKKFKSYEQFQHDIVLWHFVKSRRAPIVESPIEAKNWIVTIDNKFINFDKRKMNAAHLTLPICITPTNLIQLLQFWVPRDEDFEKAMIQNLKLPFLFHEFDAESEAVTTKILAVLSGYEQQMEALPSDSIHRILIDSSLREQMKSTNDKQEQEQYIENALIKEIAVKEKEIKEKEIKLQYTQQQNEQNKQLIKQKEDIINKEKEEKEKLVVETKHLKLKTEHDEQKINALIKNIYTAYEKTYNETIQKNINEKFIDKKNTIKIFFMSWLIFIFIWIFCIVFWNCNAVVSGILPLLAIFISGTIKRDELLILISKKKQLAIKIKIQETVLKENPKEIFEKFSQNYKETNKL